MGDLWKVPLGEGLARNEYSIIDSGDDFHALFHKEIEWNQNWTNDSLVFLDDDDVRWIGSRGLTLIWNAKEFEIDYDIDVQGFNYAETLQFERGLSSFFEDGVLDSTSGTATTKDDLKEVDKTGFEAVTWFKHTDEREATVDEFAKLTLQFQVRPEQVRWQQFNDGTNDRACWAVSHTIVIRFDGEIGYTTAGSYATNFEDGEMLDEVNLLGGNSPIETINDDEGDITINKFEVRIVDTFDWTV